MNKTHMCLLGAAITGAVLFSCSKQAEKKEEGNTAASATAMTQDQMTEHGKYIVATAGCNDCHTPKVMTDAGPAPDMTRMLSGHPAGNKLPPYDKAMVGPWVLFSPDLTTGIGPWGVTYSANLTPSQSGLGNWTEEQFINAITKGQHMGMENTRPIMPPMPWQEIRNMTTDDLKCIFAYLKTIPPIDNVVPPFEPAAQQ